MEIFLIIIFIIVMISVWNRQGNNIRSLDYKITELEDRVDELEAKLEPKIGDDYDD